MAFSNGEIAITSGIVAKAPDNPFVNGLPSFSFFPKNYSWAKGWTKNLSDRDKVALAISGISP